MSDLTEREAIARIVDPSAWQTFDNAILPFRENRGANNDEGWLYEITWKKHGFRTEQQVRNWILSDECDSSEAANTDRYRLNRSLAKADAILARKQGVAEGWVLVPREPTDAMKRAAFGPILHGGRNGPITSDHIRQQAALTFWPMMIAAAPTPASSGEEDREGEE